MVFYFSISLSDTNILVLGGLLKGNGGLLTHARLDGDNELLAGLEIGHNLLAHLPFRHLHIILRLPRRHHQAHETVVNVQQHILVTAHMRHVHVVGGRAHVLILFAREDVDADQVDLGVAVLAGLGGAHVDDLAGTAFEDDVAVLAQGGALHGVGQGGSRGGLLKDLVHFVRGGHFKWLVVVGVTVCVEWWARDERGRPGWGEKFATRSVTGVGPAYTMKRAPNAENEPNTTVNAAFSEFVEIKDTAFNGHLAPIKHTERKPVIVPAECVAKMRRHMNCRLNDASIWFNRRLEEYCRLCKPNTVIGNPTIISTEPVFAVGRIVCDTNDAKLTCKTAVLECAKGAGGGQRVQLDFTKCTDTVSLFPGQLIMVEGINNDGRRLVVNKIHKTIIDKPEYTVSRPLKMAISSISLSTPDNPENFEPLETVLEKTFDACCDVLIIFGPIMNAQHQDIASGKQMTRSPVDHYNHVMSRLSLLTTNSHCTVLLVLGPNDLFMDPVYPPCPTTMLPNLPPRVFVVNYSNIVTVSGLRMMLSPVDIVMHMSGEEVSQNGQGDRLTRLFEHFLEQRSPYPLYPPHASVPTDYQCMPICTPTPPDIMIAPSVLKAGVHVASNGSILVNPGRQSMQLVEVNPGGTPATSISVRPL